MLKETFVVWATNGINYNFVKQFDTEAEAQTFIGIEKTQMEYEQMKEQGYDFEIEKRTRWIGVDFAKNQQGKEKLPQVTEHGKVLSETELSTNAEAQTQRISNSKFSEAYKKLMQETAEFQRDFSAHAFKTAKGRAEKLVKLCDYLNRLVLGK